MAKHKKPTKDELEEQINQVVDEETPPVEEEKETSEEKPEEKETQEEVPETPEVEEKKEDAPKEKKEPEEKPEPKKQVDFQKRYSDSTREGLRLFNKNRKMAEAIENAEKVEEPTEDELKKEYPEWDVMSDTEQRMAKDSLINNRRFGAISEATKEFREIDQWEDKVREFVKDPAVLSDKPELEGKAGEFIAFATDDKRRNSNLDDITNSFLYEQSRSKPAPKRGAMFETGTGGGDKKPDRKPGKVTIQEAEVIKKSNYKEYKRLLNEGKIEFGSVE